MLVCNTCECAMRVSVMGGGEMRVYWGGDVPEGFACGKVWGDFFFRGDFNLGRFCVSAHNCIVFLLSNLTW